MSNLRSGWSRRRFVGGLTLAGTAGLFGMQPEDVAAEPPPEITALRVLEIPALCWAPQYVAEELLRAEGFARVQYVKQEIGPKLFHRLASSSTSADVASPSVSRSLRRRSYPRLR